MRVKEKVGPVFFLPRIERQLNRKKRRRRPPGERERERQRAQMTAECLTAKNERKRREGGLEDDRGNEVGMISFFSSPARRI